MAKDKKSFVLYSDYDELFNELSNEDAGKLIKHIFEYVNDRNPSTDDPIIKLSFIPIKQQLKRDLKKYEDRAERSRNNGALGGRPKKPKETQKTQQVNLKPKKPDNVNDNVNDNKINVDWFRLLDKFNAITNKKSRVVPEKAKKQILARLKEGYTKEDIIKAIEHCFKDQFHQDNNHKHLTLEFISRPDKLERYVNTTPIIKPKKSGFAWD